MANQMRPGLQGFMLFCLCSILLFSVCTDAATVRITNLMEEPETKVLIECQSSTRATDWAVKEIAKNETFSLCFKPNMVHFNTDIWCSAFRSCDGARAHVRVYSQKIDWPFSPVVNWELHSKELRRLPTDGLAQFALRAGRLLFHSVGPFGMLNW